MPNCHQFLTGQNEMNEWDSRFGTEIAKEDIGECGQRLSEV